jgi:hypothetical protein
VSGNKGAGGARLGGRRRFLVAGLVLVVGATITFGAALATGWVSTDPLLAAFASPEPTPSPSPAPTSTPSPAPSPTPTPTPEPTPTPSPTATPEPTPVLVPAALTGELVLPAVAEQHVIGLMIDDLSAARPQSGLSQADVVWHAPAEGGIPRYLALFQSEMPTVVGPVRSARDYYISWAAEWRAMYVHVGGSPQALATLRARGQGQLVYNADEFRYGGTYLYRSRDRFAPHNVYTDADRLRALAAVVGAADGPLEPAWQFGPPAHEADRPTGGRIEVRYPANAVAFDYDRRTNRYLRSVTGEPAQTDAGTGARIAPVNVVILVVRFGPIRDDPNPEKKRQEADLIGSGTAWIATNGITIEGTWRKAAETAPTLLYDAAGEPVTLTVGQTFVQVVPAASDVRIADGLVIVPVRPPAMVGESRQ